MEFNPEVAYTYKTRHLRGAILTGEEDANLIGNSHDNALEGNAGSNEPSGGSGNDTLDGGDGEDTTLFLGPSDEYEMLLDEDTLTVIDLEDGRDGKDTLRGVELLQFSDETIPAVTDRVSPRR